jgi:hypothetical protein
MHVYGAEVRSSGAEMRVRGAEARSGGAGAHLRGAESRSMGAGAHLRGAEARSIGAGAHLHGAEPRSTGAGAHLRGAESRSIGAGAHLCGAEARSTGAGAHLRGAEPRSTGAGARPTRRPVLSARDMLATASLFGVGEHRSRSVPPRDDDGERGRGGAVGEDLLRHGAAVRGARPSCATRRTIAGRRACTSSGRCPGSTRPSSRSSRSSGACSTRP